MTQQTATITVVRCRDYNPEWLSDLMQKLGLSLEWVADNVDIPGSFWGDEEAGLIRSTIYARNDTPLHSMMHEACHFVCMDEERRQKLHTNAGGSSAEENAVCYLQILLADALPGFGRAAMFRDMDAWGYSFRLGSTQRWFEEDADDARQWLASRDLLEMADQLTHSHAASLSQS